MRRILLAMVILAVAVLSMPQNLDAQLPDYTYVEDFTITDINGVEHNLYTYLDEGKYVLLDISATWCPPCWSYHQTHILNDVHNMYGPEGTDEMVVIMIEGDASTGPADLAGNTTDTQGDWITGTDYPIVDGLDGSDLATTLQIPAWPTFYIICPNRMILEEARYSSAAGHYNRLNDFGCNAAVGSNNAGTYVYNGFDGEFCGTIDFTPEIRMLNMGTENITSANIEVTANGEVIQSLAWTGDIATYEEADIVLESSVITESTSIELRIVDVNGVEDEDMADNAVGADLTKATTEVGNAVTVEIRTDNYGCESRWEIINSNDGSVVAEGGNPAVGNGGMQQYGGGCDGVGGYDSNQVYTEETMIPEDGCFEFKLYDDFGDGICCDYGNGYVRLTAADGTVLINTGNFNVELRDLFVGEVLTSVGELVGTTIDIQPNPTQGLVDVLFTGETISDVNIQVFNLAGKLMNQRYFEGAQSNIQLDMTAYTNGLYLVKLTTKDQSLTSKVVVSK